MLKKNVDSASEKEQKAAIAKAEAKKDPIHHGEVPADTQAQMDVELEEVKKKYAASDKPVAEYPKYVRQHDEKGHVTAEVLVKDATEEKRLGWKK